MRHMACAMLAIGFAPMADAQPAPATVTSGKALSEQYCVSCHVIVPSSQGSWTDAPSFQAIANKPGTTAAGISALVQKPHMNMLNTRRPKVEADAIAGYIVSLRGR